MWKIAYNILAFAALPFFLLFALTRKKIRRNLLKRLIPEGIGSGMLWIHAASIGEALIAENLVNYMRENSGFQKFLVTTNTYYAGELLEKRLGDPVRVEPLPLDFLFSVRRFLKGARPRALLIIETEIWPNLIWMTKKEKIPVMIINGRISDATIKRYTRFSFFLKHVLSDIDCVLAQSEEHRNRYISIGMNPAKVIRTGNIKYYRRLPDPPGDIARREKIITYGSVREKELDTIFETIKRLKILFPDYIIFVAPRELHLTELIEVELSSSFRCVRFSVLKEMTTADTAAEIVVVDTVGDLLDIYRRSRVAFVGGSLAPYGGQNILEPLFFGTPVLFGPFMENFGDIAEQVARNGAGIMVSDGRELVSRIAAILQDPALTNKMGEAGRKIIGEQQQVMRDTVNLITEEIQSVAHGERQGG